MEHHRIPAHRSPGRAWLHYLGLLLLALMLGAGLVQPAHAQKRESRVLPQLQREAAADPDRDFRVIVLRLDNDRKADQKVKAKGGAKQRDLNGADAFVAMIKGRHLVALGQDPAIKYITPDAPMVRTNSFDVSRLATQHLGAIGVTSIWSNSATGSGKTGKDVGVAILDTGVNATLRDFGDGSNPSRVVVSAKFNSNTNSGNDAHGHGTHVAGIIAGNSWWRSESALRGKYLGVAPEARIINVKVSDDQGMSYVSDVVNAINWVITNRTKYNIRVMNLSLVSSVPESYTTSILAAAVERAWFNGIFVVVAAGNSGPGTVLYPPANDPFVVTVGAADIMGTLSQSDDQVAPWSSYGITQDGFSKPDLIAPGRYIVSPLASGGSTLAKRFPDRIVDTSYLWLSGTSMSAPIVAGVAAIIFEQYPSWTNDQVKWLLMHTAIKLGPRDPITGLVIPLPGQGAGEVRALVADRYKSTPQYANQGLTITPLLTTSDGTTTYTSANWSAANWSAANWSSANWSAANWSAANWSAANWTTADFQAMPEGLID
jgi:serine protease AprX